MILVCIPEIKPHPRFWPSVTQFFVENQKKHDLVMHWEYREALHNVWRRTAERAITEGATHVLFFEDDHWMHPVDGLDVLLEADKQHIAFNTMQRRNPQRNSTLDRRDPNGRLDAGDNVVVGKKGEDLVQAVDLIGMYFTLIKTDLLKRIFQLEQETGICRFFWDERGPDVHICQAILDLGETPHVHWKYLLSHNDVTNSTRSLYYQIYQLNRMAGLQQPYI
jgi:hypothetical protein